MPATVPGYELGEAHNPRRDRDTNGSHNRSFGGENVQRFQAPPLASRMPRDNLQLNDIRSLVRWESKQKSYEIALAIDVPK